MYVNAALRTQRSPAMPAPLLFYPMDSHKKLGRTGKVRKQREEDGKNELGSKKDPVAE
jgi:hypothetical protein